jgi:hypothetical protein
MQVSQTHPSVTRVQNRLAEIAAKVAKCRAALPVAATVPAFIEAPEVEARTPFVSRFPHLRLQHLAAQRRMFAAIKTAGLSMQLSARMSGTNALLGTNLSSSTGCSPEELHAVADAIEANRFTANWELREVAADDDAPLPDAPPEVETAPASVGTPAPLESLDEIEMEFGLAQMRKADRARALNDLRARRVLLETALIELDRAILCA